MIIPMLLALVKAVPFRSPIYGLLTSCLVLLYQLHHFPVRSQVLVENHVIAVDELRPARENVQQNRDGENQDDPKDEPQFLEPRFFLKKRRGFHRLSVSRSEERRVGKECRSRWS